MLNLDQPPTAPGDSGAAAPRDLRRDIARRVIQIVIAMLLVTALILFGVAGTWHRPEAWLLVGLTVRTALEDRFLQADLTGYADYARRVRYRLVPELW